jgi:AcrR family transcriptional regulator
MSSAVEARARRSGRETRELIEQEALRLFAEKGVDGTSVRDIALAVGVADAALYRHFESKDAIAGEIFAKHYGELAASIRYIGAQTETFGQKVSNLVVLFCHLFDDSPDVFRFILVHQHAHLNKIADSENVVEQLVEIMRLAAANGDIKVQDANLAAAMALGAVIQPAVFRLYGRIDGPLGPLAPRIAASVLAALTAEPL